jgi:hypothetical protein
VDALQDGFRIVASCELSPTVRPTVRPTSADPVTREGVYCTASSRFADGDAHEVAIEDYHRG